VEPDQIQAVARKIIAADQSAIVVVGDAKQIGPALEKSARSTLRRRSNAGVT